MSLLKSILSDDLKGLLAHEMASYVAYGMAVLVFLRLILVRYNLISGILGWYRRSGLSSLDIVQNFDLHGKYAIVTGACRTIGFETALALCSRGCHVVLACQFLQDAERAAERIKKQHPTAKCVPMQLDLLSLGSVRRFADEYLSHQEWKLHYLVLNAGVWHWRQKTTNDGWNGVMQVNYLSQWCLTKLLVPRMIESAPSRVLIVSSWQVMFHFFSNCDENTRFSPETFRMSNCFTPSYAYSCSKVCNALFAKELNSLLRDRGVTAYSIHPGWVRTEIWSQVAFCGWLFKFGTYVLCPFSKNASQGAATTLYCALTRNLEMLGGSHFEDCRETKLDAWFDNAELRKHLWKVTEKCINETCFPLEKKHAVHIKARNAIGAN